MKTKGLGENSFPQQGVYEIVYDFWKTCGKISFLCKIGLLAMLIIPFAEKRTIHYPMFPNCILEGTSRIQTHKFSMPSFDDRSESRSLEGQRLDGRNLDGLTKMLVSFP